MHWKSVFVYLVVNLPECCLTDFCNLFGTGKRKRNRSKRKMLKWYLPSPWLTGAIIAVFLAFFFFRPWSGLLKKETLELQTSVQLQLIYIARATTTHLVYLSCVCSMTIKSLHIVWDLTAKDFECSCANCLIFPLETHILFWILWKNSIDRSRWFFGNFPQLQTSNLVPILFPRGSPE